MGNQSCTMGWKVQERYGGRQREDFKQQLGNCEPEQHQIMVRIIESHDIQGDTEQQTSIPIPTPTPHVTFTIDTSQKTPTPTKEAQHISMKNTRHKSLPAHFIMRDLLQKKLGMQPVMHEHNFTIPMNGRKYQARNYNPDLILSWTIMNINVQIHLEIKQCDSEDGGRRKRKVLREQGRRAVSVLGEDQEGRIVGATPVLLLGVMWYLDKACYRWAYLMSFGRDRVKPPPFRHLAHALAQGLRDAGVRKDVGTDKSPTANPYCV